MYEDYIVDEGIKTVAWKNIDFCGNCGSCGGGKSKKVFGKTHLYTVGELVTLDGTAVSDMQSSGWEFTLFTCTKSGEQRVTLRCKRK